MTAVGVRRAKAAFFSGCKSHPATIAPAGSNRSSHGGNEVAEASGVEGNELVSLDFRCGSKLPVHRWPPALPDLGVDRTEITRFQTFALGGPELGVKRTSISGGWMSPCSQKQTQAAPQHQPHFGTPRRRWREPSTAS